MDAEEFAPGIRALALVHVEVRGEHPFARVVISDEGKELRAEARGDGLVDATFKAIESMVQSEAELLLYSVNNVTEGTDSQGEVTVRLAKAGRGWCLPHTWAGPKANPIRNIRLLPLRPN